MWQFLGLRDTVLHTVTVFVLDRMTDRLELVLAEEMNKLLLLVCNLLEMLPARFIEEPIVPCINGTRDGVIGDNDREGFVGA